MSGVPAQQTRHRRRAHPTARRSPRILLAVVAAVGLAMVGYVLAGGFAEVFPGPGTAVQPPSVAGIQSVAPTPSASPQPRVQSTAGASGNGKFSYAKADPKVAGSKGKLLHYRVAVEQGADLDVSDFAGQVKKILADRAGWAATGKHRFQRVAEGASKDFTVYLATAATSEKMCAAEGLHTDGYLSCRLPGQVIINLERWHNAVPDYGAELAAYQAFALNHEIGHQLGHGHEACPGPGKPAPVMQQQSLDLAGCTPYGWPLREGRLYSGIPIP